MQSHYIDAESLFKKAAETGREKFGNDHSNTLESIHGLGVLYKKQDQHQAAEKFLIQAVEGRRLKLGDTHPHTLKSWYNIIELYEAWGKPEQAADWRAKLPQTEAVGE